MQNNETIANFDLRLAIFKKQIYHKDLAKVLGITTWHLSHLLSEELPDEKKERIYKALETM